MKKSILCSAMMLCSLVSAARVAVAQTAVPEFTAGQAVEVREGDSWSPATVEIKEGRKYHIKYTDGGTEEWVTADRIRKPGDSAAGAAKPGTNPSDPKSAKPADAPPTKIRATYTADQQVEAHWGGTWRPAVVNNKRAGDWYLVTYTPGVSQEWVEWWRLRKQGSTDDIAYTFPNHWYNKGDNPPRPDAGDGPADDKSKTGGGDSKSGDADKKPAFSHPVTDADLSAAQEILPTFTGPWAVAPDAEDPKQQIATSGIPLKSGQSKGRDSTILRNGSNVTLVVRDEFGSDVKSIALEKINLATGSSQGVLKCDPLSTPMAISPSGKRLLGRANAWGFGQKRRVDLWNISGTTPEHVLSFAPATKGHEYDEDVLAGDFVDEDHAWTLHHNGDLILWDITKGKAIWRSALESGARVAVSPGRKFLYGMRDEQLVCFDALTGAVKGAIEGGRPITGDIDVSPDGTRLVGLSDMVVSVYDLQAGKFLGDIGLPTSARSGDVAALPEHFALIGSQLLDLDKCGVIWVYEDSRNTFVAGGRCWNVFVANGRVALVNAKLPNDSARKADSMMMAAGQLLLKPGDRVALDINLEAKPEQIAKITEALKQQIEKIGLTIDPNSSIHVVAKTQNGQTFTERYRSTMSNPFSQGESVSITDKITALSVETEGKTAWLTQTVNRPGMIISRRQDQTIADAVGEADQFNTGFLLTARLPNYVMKPVEKVGFGTSKWALGGVKDVSDAKKGN